MSLKASLSRTVDREWQRLARRISIIERPVEAILGCVVLFAAIFFTHMIFQKMSHYSSTDSYALSMEATDVAQLQAGADIFLNGVKIGVVKKLQLDAQTYSVHIDLLIDHTIQIPTDSVATIKSSGLLGNPAIVIQAGSRPEKLQPGAFIKSKNAEPLEILIRKIIFPTE